ncbi:hypothetical protein ACQ4PT_056403 [Festuca glaucescens]
MATMGLMRREEDEFRSSFFDGETTIESRIQALEDIGATKISNRKSCRWLNDSLLLELVPRLDADEIKGLFAPPPWGEEQPLSAFCMTSAAAGWDVFRTIDMDVQARVRAFIEGTSGDNDLLVLDVQDPFQRLLLHGVCEFYNVASETTSSTVRECGGDKLWKTTMIRKRPGTAAPSRITLVDFLARRKNGSL